MSIFWGKIKDLQFKPSNMKEWLTYLEQNDGKEVSVDVNRETGVRTLSQNNALHLGLEMIAKTLNEAGLDMKKVLKPEIDIEWTKDTVKKYMFKPVMEMLTQKKSTTELDKVSEITEIWDTLMKFLGEKHAVEYIPFPSEENKPQGKLPEYPSSNGPVKGF